MKFSNNISQFIPAEKIENILPDKCTFDDCTEHASPEIFCPLLGTPLCAAHGEILNDGIGVRIINKPRSIL